MSGNLGTMTFRDRGDDMVAAARVYTNKSKGNGATEEQRRRRCLLANLVNMYSAFKPAFKKAFEFKGKHVSDYNQFVKVNLSAARIMLPKADVDADKYICTNEIVSKGSFPRGVDVSYSDSKFSLGGLQGGTATFAMTETVAEFTARLLANNNYLKVGDQITFLAYFGNPSPKAEGVTLAFCAAGIYEITLSEDDERPLNEIISGSSFALTLDTNMTTLKATGCQSLAVIFSRIENGKLVVSNAKFATSLTDEKLNPYIDGAMAQRAMADYGYQGNVLLTPGDN